MEKYESNSRLSKERRAEAAKNDKPKVEKVVSGKVKTRENKSRKILGTFISTDANSVWEAIFMDVLVPSLKKLVSEGVNTAADLFLYGESRGRRDGRSESKVSYRRYYDDRYGDRRESERRRGTAATRNRFDYDELVYETRGEAEMVLDSMKDTVEEYGLVSVADMYDFSGVSAPFTSHDYGWTSLRAAEVRRVRDGYVLDLPKFMPIS